MFKKIMCLLLLVTVASSVFLPVSAEEESSSLLFFDDFYAGLEKWSGGESAEIVELDVRHALKMNGKNTDIVSSMPRQSQYYMFFDIVMKKNKYFGIFLNYSDSKSTYLMQYLDNSVKFYIKETAFTEIASAPLNLLKDKTYRINIKVDNGSFTLYIDGEEILKTEDQRIPSGTFAIRDYSFAQESYYSNMVVTKDEAGADEYFGNTDIPNVFEDFEGGTARWTVNGDGFSLEDDGTNKKLLFNNRDNSRESFAVMGNEKWADYMVSMQLEHMGNNTAGIVFRFVDEGNYYMVQFRASDNKIHVVSRENHGPVKNIAEKNYVFEDETVNLGIEVTGNIVTVFDEEKTIVECKTERKNGLVGIRGFSGKFAVDNISILPSGSNRDFFKNQSSGVADLGQEGESGEVLDIDFSLPDYAASPLSGKTTKARFMQRKEELPDEMEVIKPAAVKGKLEIYVSNDGSDQNAGTKDSPLATLSKAISFVKKQEISEGAVIYLREGTYTVSKTISINNIKPQGAPVIISNYNGEKVKFIGGGSIEADKFSKVTDSEILKRLSPSATSQIYVADVDPSIIQSTTINSKVFVNGSEMTLARYPNSGYVTTGTIIDAGPRTYFGEPDDGRGFEFEINDLTPKKWLNTGEIYMYGAFSREWSLTNIKVREINEKSIRGDSHVSFGAREGQKFYYYNILEELDIPGEYYIDRTKNKLYVYPKGEFGENVSVTINTLSQNMIEVNSCENFVLNGIEFDGGTKDGLVFERCKNVVAQNIKLSNFAGNTVNIKDTCEKTGIIYSDIEDSAGVSLAGGDRNNLLPGKNFIQNVSMYLTSMQYSRLYGVGNIFSHNYVCGAEIRLYDANENIIEYNEFAATNIRTKDAGAIYAGSDITKRGNQIRYNYIHHIASVDNISSSPSGIYLDDLNSDNQCYGNVFYDVPTGLHFNGGRENTIYNNLIISKKSNSVYGINIDSLFVSDKPNSEGVVYWDHDGPIKIYPSLKNFNINEAPWSTRYPLLVNYMEDEPRLPKYNYIENNILIDYQKIMLIDQALDTMEMKNNHILKSSEDIGIKDINNQDLTFRENAKIFEIAPSFTPPPFEKMGLLDKKKINIGTLSPLLPTDGQKNVNSSNIELIWTALPYAHIYNITVAYDKEMKDIVGQYKSNDASFVFRDGEAGKTYYWYVEPVSEAKSIDVEYTPMKPASFTCISKNVRNMLYVDMITEQLYKDYKAPEKSDAVKSKALLTAQKFENAKDEIINGNDELFNSLYAEYEAYENENSREVRYSENYESLSEGEVPQGLTLTDAKSGKTNIDGSGVLEFTDNKEDAYAVFMQSINSVMGNFALNMRIKPMQDTCKLNVKFRSNEGDPVVIILNKNGTINIGTGGGYVEGRQIGTYKSGEWLNIKVYGDTLRRRYSIEVNGSTLVSNELFEDEFTSELLFNTLVLTAGNNIAAEHKYTGTFYLDDINFSSAEVRVTDSTVDLEMINRTTNVQQYTDMIFLAENSALSMVNSQVRTLDAAVYEKNGRTFIPVRFISEYMGIPESEIVWNENDESVTIKNVCMKIGSKIYTVDGVEKTMDEAPELINGRTFMPLRALSEALGLYVYYKNGLIVVGVNPIIIDDISSMILLDTIK